MPKEIPKRRACLYQKEGEIVQVILHVVCHVVYAVGEPNGPPYDVKGIVSSFRSSQLSLTLSFTTQSLKNANDSVVADTLENKTHAVAALAQLVL
jgi:hypothetical protein